MPLQADFVIEGAWRTPTWTAHGLTGCPFEGGAGPELELDHRGENHGYDVSTGYIIVLELARMVARRPYCLGIASHTL